VTIARFPFIHVIKEPDILYNGIDLSILAIVEVGTGIITTAAGTLRPLFRQQFGGSDQRFTDSHQSQRANEQAGEGTRTTTSDLESLATALAPVDKRG
jgi:hypothetical protein